MMHRQRLLHNIARYAARYPDERGVAERFEELIRTNSRCFERDSWSGHITGSAWLVNERGTHVLLTHHRKLGSWMQLGGHSDGEPDTLKVATREAEEESGLPVKVIDTDIFDLDVHEIPARQSDPAHHHYDVRFVFRAAHERFLVSAESLDLAWVPVATLHAHPVDESVLRMGRKWLSGQYVTESNR